MWKRLLGNSDSDDELKRLIEQRRIDEEQRQSEDIIALQHGGIPLMAQQRIANLRASENQCFSSNLSANELSLVRRLAWRPVGTVAGSAMFHVGVFYGSASQDCEISEISNAYEDATELAVSRLQTELKLMGAHGVVGVRLNIVRHAFDQEEGRTIEVQLIGTAITGEGKAPDEPFLSTLSAQEWFALKRAGYEPIGIVWGYSAWFMLTTSDDEMRLQSFSNVEFRAWSDSLRAARDKALTSLSWWQRKLHATGVVGIKLDKRMREVKGMTLYGSSSNLEFVAEQEAETRKREHHILEMSIIGTAINPRSATAHHVKQTQFALSLRDGRLRRVAPER
jgi:uncharacterized protein YbjQ (UPF0145 family)